MTAAKWRARVPGEVIAAPAVAQGLVFVRSNDGRVTAFDAGNGTQKWFNPSELPALTVRGNAPVVTGPGVLFIGRTKARLPRWPCRMGVPCGNRTLATAKAVPSWTAWPMSTVLRCWRATPSS